jgi:hypothetical protein
VKFPITKDPLKKGMNPWLSTLLVITIAIILGLGGWGIYKYITREKVSDAQIEQVTEAGENVVPTMEAEESVAAEAEGEVAE